MKVIRLFGIITSFMVMLFKTMAVPYVLGDITIVGGARLNGPLGVATQINSFSAPPIVISVDGDFATTVNPTDPVLFTLPFKFGVSTPYTTLYSVGGWNFELFSSSIDFQNNNFLGISGVGEITGNGFLPTPATFRFSTQSPSAGGYYSFSASSATPPGSTTIPDGGSTLIFSAIPILGLLAVRKFNKK